MADFRFLHAADIHLDSPLHGLARYDGVPLEEVRGATRSTFDRMIRYAIEEAVDFIVIAGDLFDGDWKDMGTGLYFARAMGRLAAAGVPAFVLNGNHDAASVLTRSLPWPEMVKVFPSKSPASFRLERLGVVLHGQSFPTQHVYEDLAGAYPPPEPNAFNIGVLHTALGGAEGHAPYAPTSVEALQARGYQYWALGHVHDFARVADDPPVVFPGNLQGRNIRETGPKGAALVEVRDRAVSDIRLVPLDVARWARARVECTSLDTIEAVHGAIRSELSLAHGLADGRPLIVRVQLTGASPLAGQLRDRAGELRDEVRALAAAVSPDLWLEKLSIGVEPPAHPPRPEGDAPDDLLDLLAEAAASPELAELLAAELKPFLNGRPAVSDPGSEDLAAAAERGEWGAVLDAALAALPARLGVGAA